LNLQYLSIEAINQIFGDPRVNPFLAVARVDFCLMYVYRAKCRGEIDEKMIPKHFVTQLCQVMLMWCRSVRNAAAVIEGIMDQIRFDSQQTRFFVRLLLFLWRLELSWDGVALRDIAAAVVIARTQAVAPVPSGAAQLRAKLEESAEFRSLLEKWKKPTA